MLHPTITPPTNNPHMSVGDHVVLDDNPEPVGAVRSVRGDVLTVYVEGAGDFQVPLAAIKGARYGKVFLDSAQLDEQFLAAARAAHDNEVV